VLRPLDRLFNRITSLIRTVVPDEMNPLAVPGAVANIAFVVALVTGLFLLYWYGTSPVTAHASIEAMMESPWTAGLMRSLHRYSSDVCLLFILIHAVKMLFAARFSGARWLAWVTGVVCLGLMWLDGWLGYWLVWDQRGLAIAEGTSKMIDALHLLPDPLSRSLLIDDNINALFFFLIFFVHMVIPLGLGIALWLHLARLNKARFLPSREMTIACILSMVVLSIAIPAQSGPPAATQTIAAEYELDLFYMLPLMLTDRMSGGGLWLLLFGASVLVCGIPWFLGRRKVTDVHVTKDRCAGCTDCVRDCPFGAIQMVPWDQRDFAIAQIDPALCIACGVCVGSCHSTAIQFSTLNRKDVEARIDAWFAEETDSCLLFLCAHSGAGTFTIDEASGRCEQLPGYRVVAVPCVSWIHPDVIHRAARRGAAGVLVVACASGDAPCRTGVFTAIERFNGRQEPMLEVEKLKGMPFAMEEVGVGGAGVIEKARAFHGARTSSPVGVKRHRRAALTAAFAVMMVFSGLAWAGSRLAYEVPLDSRCELVLSVKHSGEFLEGEEDYEGAEDLAPHMRAARQLQKERAPVRLQVELDGEIVLDTAIRPGGVYRDTASIGMRRVTVDPGTHSVRIRIGETGDPGEWTYEEEKVLEFRDLNRRVVLFTGEDGFRWH
jgi:ferredoxin/coenzyme F420-reducing hydrogenase delta subunit